MTPVSVAAIVAAALVLGHARPAVAEAAKFRYLVSAYFDEKGSGFKLPEGIACDSTGRLVVGDTGNDRLVRFTYRDKTVSGGSEIRLQELSAPSRVQLNSKGEIYALDGKRRRIVHLGPDGDFKDVVAFAGVPPPGTIVPKSFAIDASDRLYVLDAFSARVLVLDPAGQFQYALVVPDDAGFISDLTVDFAGNVLLLDSLRRRLFSAGKGASSFIALASNLSESLVTLPTYIAAAKGIIFIVEGTGGSVVSLGQNGTFLARHLTKGWKEGSVSHPSQICINDKDEVFIADRDNSRIQVFGLVR